MYLCPPTCDVTLAAGKFRVVMRCDKIPKIACNHFITADMRLSAMQTSETAWCWNAVDFAENQPRNEQLALKFKVSQQLALKFKVSQQLALKVKVSQRLALNSRSVSSWRSRSVSSWH